MSDSYKREINVGDVIPNDGNPREDFGDVGDLAATFAANGGQPYNPIIVVPDGAKFRLVDGERRWRAMEAIGTERCDALVFLCMEDAEAAVAMMATDDSKPLTSQERLRGFQSMLALGCDDEIVAAVAKTDAATVRRVRRIAAEAPEQTTLDGLIAAADDEFTYDERQQIMAEAANRWGSPEIVAERFRKRHERERRLTEIRDALPESIEYMPGEKPYQPERERLIYLATARNAKAAAKFAAKHDGAADLVAYEDGIAYAIYQRASEDAIDPKEAEAAKVRQFRDEHVAAYKEAYHDMCDFAVSPWVSAGPVPPRFRQKPHEYRPTLCAAIQEYRKDADGYTRLFSNYSYPDAQEMLGTAAGDARCSEPAILEVCTFLMLHFNRTGLIGYAGTSVTSYAAREFVVVYDALVADGWEPSEGARKLREMCPKEES